MVTLICSRCGKQFTRKASRATRAQHPYCSFECRKRPVTLVCEWCGKQFQPLRGGKAKDIQRFCSLSCVSQCANSRRLNRVTVQCAYCGKETWRHACRLKRNQAFFCSMECKNAHHASHITGESNPRWIGGAVGYRGSDWDSARRAALDRDNHTCQECGISETDSLSKYGLPLQVHHIDPYRNGHNNDLDNLMSICVRCHGVIEAQFTLAEHRRRLSQSESA